jgi:hypothetical protein
MSALGHYQPLSLSPPGWLESARSRYSAKSLGPLELAPPEQLVLAGYVSDITQPATANLCRSCTVGESSSAPPLPELWKMCPTLTRKSRPVLPDVLASWLWFLCHEIEPGNRCCLLRIVVSPSPGVPNSASASNMRMPLRQLSPRIP